MEYTSWQKSLAEFVGVLALVFIAGGAMMIADLGASNAGLVTVAFGYGLVYAAMVSAIGHVSGGHINPAVTIGAWVTQKISSGLALVYLVAQFAGGIVGALLLRAAFPKSIWSATPHPLGITSVAAGISKGQGVLIEAVLTFFLVWVVFATTVDPHGSFNKIAGLAIGFVVVMDAMMGGPVTGASMNPARTLGPAIVAGKFPGIWVYFVGPIAGGIVAAALYDGVLIRRREPEPVVAEASAYDAGEEAAGIAGPGTSQSPGEPAPRWSGDAGDQPPTS
jgi:MIP family channel proteins